jgi:hypothetical protein
VNAHAPPRSRRDWISAIQEAVDGTGWQPRPGFAVAVVNLAINAAGELDRSILRRLAKEFEGGSDPARRRLAVSAVAEAVGEWRIASRSRPSAYPIVDNLVERLTRALGGCPDFAGESAEEFSMLLRTTVHFLRTRMDGESNRFPYLFDKEAAEIALANDYAQWLEGTEIGQRVSVEVRHIGGGRVDVLISYARRRFVAEVKRDPDAGLPENADVYLPQAAQYAATDVGLGLLLILDLGAKTHWVPSLRDSIWIRQLQGAAGQLTRCVVVVRVPGNRSTPSKMKGRRN